MASSKAFDLLIYEFELKKIKRSIFEFDIWTAKSTAILATYFDFKEWMMKGIISLDFAFIYRSCTS